MMRPNETRSTKVAILKEAAGQAVLSSFFIEIVFSNVIFYTFTFSYKKELLILSLIHRCLERCLVKGKIIRNFTTLTLSSKDTGMKKTAVFIILISLSLISVAQQTRFLTDPQVTFKQAQDYFIHEQYSLAYPLLKDLQLQQREADRSAKAINYEEIKYYTTVCALEQNERGAVPKAQEFIALEDNTPRVQMMSFHLAEYYFRQQDYPQAMGLYEKVNVENLSNSEIAA